MARRLVSVAVAFAMVLIAASCASTPTDQSSPSSPTVASIPSDVAALAERFSLQPVSESTALGLQLPRNLAASGEWGLKQLLCRRAGFDLRPYLGKPVQVTGYLLSERIGGEPLTLWVVRSEGKLAGAYVSDTVSTPGLYAVNEL